MTESYSSKLVFRSTPEQLTRLMRLDETCPELWHSEDLVAMVRHQLAAPLEFDLNTLKLDAEEENALTKSASGTDGSRVRTFGDLLLATRPSLELLRLTHRFFKQKIAAGAKGSPDRKVAYLFYLLSIVAARVSAGARISKLRDEELIDAIGSMRSKSWVGEEIRARLIEGRKAIIGEPG